MDVSAVATIANAIITIATKVANNAEAANANIISLKRDMALLYLGEIQTDAKHADREAQWAKREVEWAKKKVQEFIQRTIIRNETQHALDLINEMKKKAENSAELTETFSKKANEIYEEAFKIYHSINESLDKKEDADELFLKLKKLTRKAHNAKMVASNNQEMTQKYANKTCNIVGEALMRCF